jgi:hypothetical protein
MDGARVLLVCWQARHYDTRQVVRTCARGERGDLMSVLVMRAHERKLEEKLQRMHERAGVQQ